MTTDNELRKLILAPKYTADDFLPLTPIYSPEEVLATARAVWAAAIEEAAKVCESGYWAYGQDKTLPVSLQCAAAIRSIGSEEQI